MNFGLPANGFTHTKRHWKERKRTKKWEILGSPRMAGECLDGKVAKESLKSCNPVESTGIMRI
jgi:hypothetical protein